MFLENVEKTGFSFPVIIKSKKTAQGKKWNLIKNAVENGYHEIVLC